MTVKRYDQIIHDGVMEPISDGKYVTYSDYQKLVAENAALKVAVDGFNQELYGKGFEVLGWHLNGDTEPLDSWFEDNNWNPETPATDAAIAEIKAQGVDEFADSKKHESEASGSILSFEISIAAKVFATNLRAGVKS